MFEVVETIEFGDWFERLRDHGGKARIVDRLLLLRKGRFGDFRSVGDGVAELRFHFGPGYRIYFTRRQSDDTVIILLAGGDKDTQSRDIRRAKRLAEREQAQ